MFKFILQILIMLSLGAVLYLIARAVPRVSDEEIKKNHATIPSHGFMTFLEKIDDKLKLILEKLLRRTRIWILKFDNFIVEKLKKFKKEASKETAFPVEEKKETDNNGIEW